MALKPKEVVARIHTDGGASKETRKVVEEWATKIDAAIEELRLLIDRVSAAEGAQDAAD